MTGSPRTAQRMFSQTPMPRATLVGPGSGAAAADAASIGSSCRASAAAAGRTLPARRGAKLLLARLRLDDLVELQLAALDPLAAVVGERGVTVLVDVYVPSTLSRSLVAKNASMTAWRSSPFARGLIASQDDGIAS